MSNLEIRRMIYELTVILSQPKGHNLEEASEDQELELR